MKTYNTTLNLLSLLLLLIIIFCNFVLIEATPKLKFEKDENIPVFVNKLYPGNQPAKSIKFDPEIFCFVKENSDEDDENSKNSLLDNYIRHSLVGDRIQKSSFQIPFHTNVERQKICKSTINLSAEQVNWFIESCDKDVQGEFIIDELVFSQYLCYKELVTDGTETGGESSHISYNILNNIYFNLHYQNVNDKYQFLGGNVTYLMDKLDSSKYVKLEYGKPVSFDYYYSVKQIKNMRDSNRFLSNVERLVYHARIQGFSSGIVERAHQIAIVNSFLMGLFLVSIFSYVLMRTLRNDFTRYTKLDEVLMESNNEDIDDSGQKQVQGDVFRSPSNPMLFCSIIGTGSQLFLVFVVIVSIVMLKFIEPGTVSSRGSLQLAAIIIYALTSCVAGYVSGRLYKQIGGEHWSLNAILTSTIFALPFFIVFSIINSVALIYKSTYALPFFLILGFIFFWISVVFPITIISSRYAYNKAPEPDFPCRVSQIPRVVPQPKQWQRNSIHMIIAGFLAFSSIYIEVYTVLYSVQGYQTYALFGIYAFSTFVLFIVSGFITVLFTYYRLTTENYHWWQYSVINGGSLGIFLLAYTIYFYFSRSQFEGIMQFTFYFGYMALFSYALFLILGSFGFMLSSKFVRYIYASIKSD